MNLPYDALLFVSFGGPEGRDEVMPFLENVLRGKPVPPERMREVAHHYELFDGVSPINEQNRRLIRALENDFATHDIHLPIYWGNRNWHPTLTDTMRRMRDNGIKRALAFVTSAYSSYSGCRQYRENIAQARETIGDDAPHIDKLRVFYNHPGFIDANVEHIEAALDKISEAQRAHTEIVFTAHSIPVAMAQNCAYELQLRETCRLIVERLRCAEGDAPRRWQLVYQSRSGSPMQAWLEPDVCDYLTEIKGAGATDVVIAPIGFISDHMEVLYDLDTEAKGLCEKMNLNMVRAACAGTHPAFVSMIRELVLERMTSNTERRALGRFPASHDVCPTDCCLLGASYGVRRESVPVATAAIDSVSQQTHTLPDSEVTGA